MSLPTISPTDAKRLIDQGATLIDIRGADERAREHIPGSHHGPLAQLTDFAGVGAPIIFHCRSGMRTASNAARLRDSVPCEAYMLEGGLEAWRQAGLPVTADKSQPIELSRQVMIAAGTLVLVFVLLGTAVAPVFYLLAGLIGAGLVFGGVSGWCGMAKLLEIMPWNRRAAVAVALNAGAGLAAHARLGTVKWPCAMVFTAAGVAGAFTGASLGKQLGGSELLALFGLLMIGVGIYMIAVEPKPAGHDVRLTQKSARHLLPRLILIGAGVGLLSGFFGIGGGFLIVPGLVLATGMALQNAIATSLFAVMAFGLTTAASYAVSGLVDWRLAALVIVGGVLGTMFGTRVNTHLAGHKRALAGTFASIVIFVGLYIVVSGIMKLMAVG